MLSIGCQPCLKYLAKGFCYPNCHFKAAHCTPVGEDEKKIDNFIKGLRGKWYFGQEPSGVFPTIRISPDKSTHIAESKNSIIEDSNSVENNILLQPSNLSIEHSTKNLKSVIKGMLSFKKKDSNSTFEESKNEEKAIYTSQDDIVIRNPHKAEEITSPLVGNVDRTLQEAEEVSISDKSSQKVMIDEIRIEDRNLQKERKEQVQKVQFHFQV